MWLIILLLIIIILFRRLPFFSATEATKDPKTGLREPLAALSQGASELLRLPSHIFVTKLVFRAALGRGGVAKAKAVHGRVKLNMLKLLWVDSFCKMVEAQ